jgi:hypothetical protein
MYEQRLQLRFPIAPEEGMTGLLDGEHLHAVEVPIHDLSLGGAGLVIPDQRIIDSSPTKLRLMMKLNPDLGDTSIEPIHLFGEGGERGGGRLVGVQFRPKNEQILRNVCRYLVQRHSQPTDRLSLVSGRQGLHEVVDAARAKQLLEFCCRRQRSLQLFDSLGHEIGLLRPDVLQAEGLSGRIEVSKGPLLLGGLHHLLFHSFLEFIVVSLPLLARDGGHLSFGMPVSIFEGGKRSAARLRPEDDYPVYFEFIHPQISNKLIRKLAREVGLSGLSFDLDVEEDLLARGTILESGFVRLPSGRSLSCKAIVRHTFHQNEGFGCGIELIDFAGNGRMTWVQQLLAKLNPEIVEATPFTVDKVWDVLERSGYFEWKASDLQAMKAPFRRVWSRLIGLRDGSRCWIRTYEGKVIGTVSTSRLYSNTFLIHQLGATIDEYKGTAHRLIVLAELLPRTAFQWLSATRPGGNILGYVAEENPFNHWVWKSFFDKPHDGAPQDFRIVRMHDFHLPDLAFGAPAQIWVREPGRVELQRISDDLLRRDGSLVHEAFDYGVEKLSLDSRAEEGDAAILGIKRKILLGGLGEEPLGYCILESSVQGINIFSLYDTCRVVLLRPIDEPGMKLVRDAFFSAAISYHKELGSRAMLYLVGEGDAPPPPDIPCWELDLMRALIPGNLASSLIEHLEAIWAQR